MRVGGQGYGSLTILAPPTHYSAIFRLQTIMQIHNEQLLCDKYSEQTVFVPDKHSLALQAFFLSIIHLSTPYCTYHLQVSYPIQ